MYRTGRTSHSFRVGAVAVEVEAKEAAQRTAPGNSLQDEAETTDAHQEEEDQGEAVLAMMGALQVHLHAPH